MAGLGLTGFVAKTIDEIKAEIETALKDAIDPALDVSATSVMGQIIGVFAERERQLWLVSRDVYSAFTPGGASGQALTNLSLLTGTKREDATFSTVTATVNLNAGTTLPAGSRANVDGDPDAVFETLADVENTGGSPANFPVAMQAVDPGPVRANAGTLTEITTPVSGWNSVTNALDADMGEPDEVDQDLRERREFELRIQGSSNIDAIAVHVSQVDGVEDVIGDEDLEAHTFEITLWDGTSPAADDNEIAQTIWDFKPAGIESTGPESGTAVDRDGNDRVISFRRADGLEVYLELDITIDSDLFPVDGDTQIKDAVVAFADERWEIGADVILSQIYVPIFSVSGVVSVVAIRAGFSASPTETLDLSVAATEKALSDTSRIDIAHV